VHHLLVDRGADGKRKTVIALKVGYAPASRIICSAAASNFNRPSHRVRPLRSTLAVLFLRAARRLASYRSLLRLAIIIWGAQPLFVFLSSPGCSGQLHCSKFSLCRCRFLRRECVPSTRCRRPVLVIIQNRRRFALIGFQSHANFFLVSSARCVNSASGCRSHLLSTFAGLKYTL